MGEMVDALQRLQEIELQIGEVRQRIGRKRRAAEKQEKELLNLDESIQIKELASRADQMEADGLDLDLKVQEVNVVKLRQALNTAKTNKEYSAVLTQLNTNKADISKLEERALAIYSQLEIKKKEVTAVREEREKDRKRLEELKEAAREIEEASEERLAQLSAERDRAAAAVPPAALSVFDRAAEKHDGEAMALINRTHPKRAEFACEGCNMAVTLEQVNTLLSRDEAVLCNTCGRILYLDSQAATNTR